MSSVLDASALLAYLKEEPGGDAVEELLAESSNMSAANWAEVLSKLAEEGDDVPLTIERFETEGLLGGNIIVHPLDEALAEALQLPAVTADRAWDGLALRVQVQLIR